jgi:hypothetical protein
MDEWCVERGAALRLTLEASDDNHMIASVDELFRSGAKVFKIRWNRCEYLRRNGLGTAESASGCPATTGFRPLDRVIAAIPSSCR